MIALAVNYYIVKRWIWNIIVSNIVSKWPRPYNHLKCGRWFVFFQRWYGFFFLIMVYMTVYPKIMRKDSSLIIGEYRHSDPCIIVQFSYNQAGAVGMNEDLIYTPIINQIAQNQLQNYIIPKLYGGKIWLTDCQHRFPVEIQFCSQIRIPYLVIILTYTYQNQILFSIQKFMMTKVISMNAMNTLLYYKKKVYDDKFQRKF